MDPLISVIYVNYNTSKLLISSVESLQAQCASRSFEIIIVDNNSDSVQQTILTQWFSGASSENLNLLSSAVNRGFAAANNAGAEIARGKYLFFLNPDTVVLNDVLEIFFSFMEASSDTIAACGGNLLRADHSPNYSYGNFPGILLEICNIGLGLSFLLNGYYKKRIALGRTISSESIIEVPYIVGANIFSRKDTFNSAGRFDENYFMYYEETDLFFRLTKLNYRFCILPQAKIVHLEGGAVGKSTVKDFNYLKFELILKSKLYYYKKWYADSLPIIKGLVKIQILVQYLKGKWGNDLKRLYSIYEKVKC